MPVSQDDVEPVATEPHHTSWSVNLETPAHAEDRALVERGARTAVEYTVPGTHVNLVTHATHGHPMAFLEAALAETDATVDLEYVDRCGCGGHVARAHVRE